MTQTASGRAPYRAWPAMRAGTSFWRWMRPCWGRGQVGANGRLGPLPAGGTVKGGGADKAARALSMRYECGAGAVLWAHVGGVLWALCVSGRPGCRLSADSETGFVTRSQLAQKGVRCYYEPGVHGWAYPDDWQLARCVRMGAIGICAGGAGACSFFATIASSLHRKDCMQLTCARCPLPPPTPHLPASPAASFLRSLVRFVKGVVGKVADGAGRTLGRHRRKHHVQAQGREGEGGLPGGEHQGTQGGGAGAAGVV
jgi:hypothetical protein